jgi:hypothetical protein
MQLAAVTVQMGCTKWVILGPVRWLSQLSRQLKLRRLNLI